MKVAVIGGIAFAIGLAGGTGIGMRGGSAPTLADSSKTHADSSKGHADSTVAKPDSLKTAAVPDSTGAKPPEITEPAKGAPVTAPAPTAPSAEAAFDPKQLASALGKLSAADAAPLLARFSDDEIVASLKVMGMARAGAIVAKLPEPRGTKLSRRLLLELGAGGHQ